MDHSRRTVERFLPAGPQQPGLSRLTRLVARLLSTPSAQVSLLTDVQTVVAGTGLPEGAVGSRGPLGESLCTVTAGLRAPLIVSDARSDERVSQLPPVTSGLVGAYLGVPLTAADGTAVGALCVFDRAPRAWQEQDVVLLGEFAEAVMGELELSALAAEYEDHQQRWEVVVEAAGIGSFEYDPETGSVDLDAQMCALFSLGSGAAGHPLAQVLDRIHPEDRERVRTAIAAALESHEPYHVEHRVLRPDGPDRWVVARGRTVSLPTGGRPRFIGAAWDATDLRDARDEAARLVEKMATGFIALDDEWRITYINAAAEQVLRSQDKRLVGQMFWEALPGSEDSEFGRQYHHAMTTGQAVAFEAYYEHLGAWFEVRAEPVPEGLALYFLDVTARRQAEELAEATSARLALLATVSAELNATLDTDAAAEQLARLVVPALADWCVVTVLLADGRLRDVGWHHDDPELLPYVSELARTRHEGLAVGVGVEQASRLRRPVRVASGLMRHARRLVGSPAALAALESLAPESMVVVPLLARGHVVGALNLCRDSGRPPMSDAEVDVAVEVAARASTAIDNARLYGEQRGLAEALQRSLLTEPPEPDHLEIEVRYRPAAESASVGGDWFDSFITEDGATTLIIGDVVGHDTAAAAAMGQVRGLLRGIAWESGAAPATVLARLDSALRGLRVDTTATVVLARLEQTTEERRQGVTRLRWSNAGHPPPVLIGDDGGVTILRGGTPDLLLGIDPDTPRAETLLTVPRGVTLVLYTDGLVERRGEDLDVGLARLRDTLAGLVDRPLGELCDQLLERMLPAAEDDVALIAVRLHPEDPAPGTPPATSADSGAKVHP